ncbi:hypothetical protein [Arthrobacter bambusae]|uniref:Uncharacterized protein n=1 Tax=Arthrobacter bambusae TaxID=1338426 RepID=A0AAW8D5Z0_9MICC|nr:hypothetical protein [Arthrobacter bambusae]MDP9903125.1 hypothetical protein [Arthrobacter bambusae]MDQ0128881.1 hypothetical protein [Arthrobacter bambusae]MDQ0180222.1 hypothetical protein [Arthrobacter bambusae]
MAQPPVTTCLPVDPSYLDEKDARMNTLCPDDCPASIEAWDRVRAALLHAKKVSFDSCHTIYLLMDDTQVSQSNQHGFRSLDPKLEHVRDWFNSSCPMRSVIALSTKPSTGSSRRRVLIGEFELEFEEHD